MAVHPTYEARCRIRRYRRPVRQVHHHRLRWSVRDAGHRLAVARPPLHR